LIANLTKEVALN